MCAGRAGAVRQGCRPTMATGCHGGFTLAESVMALALSSLVVAILLALWSCVARTTAATVASEEATRSLLLATEIIGRDLRNLAGTGLSSNLSITDGGRHVSLRVPACRGGDPWSVELDVVTYSLIPGSGALIRKDRNGSRRIPGCNLSGLAVRFLPVGELSPGRAYVQVTVRTLSARGSIQSLSILVPVAVATVPGAYLSGGLPS